MTVYINIAVVLLLCACSSAPVRPVDTTVDPECSMVFGGQGMQFLGCESGAFVNQTSK